MKLTAPCHVCLDKAQRSYSYTSKLYLEAILRALAAKLRDEGMSGPIKPSGHLPVTGSTSPEISTNKSSQGIKPAEASPQLPKGAQQANSSTSLDKRSVEPSSPRLNINMNEQLQQNYLQQQTVVGVLETQQYLLDHLAQIQYFLNNPDADSSDAPFTVTCVGEKGKMNSIVPPDGHTESDAKESEQLRASLKATVKSIDDYYNREKRERFTEQLSEARLLLTGHEHKLTECGRKVPEGRRYPPIDLSLPALIDTPESVVLPPSPPLPAATASSREAKPPAGSKRFDFTPRPVSSEPLEAKPLKRAATVLAEPQPEVKVDVKAAQPPAASDIPSPPPLPAEALLRARPQQRPAPSVPAVEKTTTGNPPRRPAAISPEIKADKPQKTRAVDKVLLTNRLVQAFSCEWEEIDWKRVNKLVRQGADPSVLVDEASTQPAPLFLAAADYSNNKKLRERGDPHKVDRLACLQVMLQHPSAGKALNQIDKSVFGNTPLCWAIATGDHEAATLMVNAIEKMPAQRKLLVQPNRKTHPGIVGNNTPLVLAMKTHNLELARRLLPHYSLPDLQDHKTAEGYDAIELACYGRLNDFLPDMLKKVPPSRLPAIEQLYQHAARNKSFDVDLYETDMYFGHGEGNGQHAGVRYAPDAKVLKLLRPENSKATEVETGLANRRTLARPYAPTAPIRKRVVDRMPERPVRLSDEKVQDILNRNRPELEK